MVSAGKSTDPVTSEALIYMFLPLFKLIVSSTKLTI